MRRRGDTKSPAQGPPSESVQISFCKLTIELQLAQGTARCGRSDRPPTQGPMGSTANEVDNWSEGEAGTRRAQNGLQLVQRSCQPACQIIGFLPTLAACSGGCIPVSGYLQPGFPVAREG
ncbi:hypothetical protein BO70DRAFT_138612 [Aspergillus heteromorphus CBS 117.55]|uniref:Uncharacterized protein n=1 Tax=Aspergillus heteromorphus CBS 117.55 TaxID=1448321 RepID=A0A317V8R1_9EURO|nr:uncharacterized protein BO70DRAFT_138612 [Aspergillus heteromorphus CBS 117.55]PWY70445.1 hypothetical protein BO70DRAFT_138612 [Aspergillus heteromorphus CBS 117.55]